MGGEDDYQPASNNGTSVRISLTRSLPPTRYSAPKSPNASAEMSIRIRSVTLRKRRKDWMFNRLFKTYSTLYNKTSPGAEYNPGGEAQPGRLKLPLFWPGNQTLHKDAQ